MTLQNAPDALETYFQLMTMNGAAQIFHTAQQLKIFEIIGQGKTTAPQIADHAGLQLRPTALFLEILCGMGMLRKNNEAYEFAPVMSLLSGSYQSLGNAYWQHLPAFMKTGEPMAYMDDPQKSAGLYKAQVASLDWMMRPSAEAAAELLDAGGKTTGHVLDVGAGSGVWSFSLARKHKQLSVTAQDRPEILELTKDYAVQLQIQDRVRYLPGNYHEIDFPGETYDCAIVGNVTHIETPEGNTALFKKLKTALKPGGKLAVIDVFPGQDKGNLQRSLYALGLALRTRQGTVYTAEQLKGFLREAGFIDFTFQGLPVVPYTMGLLIATKSKEAAHV